MDPTPAGASPSPHAGPTNDTGSQGDTTVYPADGRDSASETLYESRGNLDTLAAAALKPLADDRYIARRDSSPSYQQQPAQPHRDHSPSGQDSDSGRAETRPSGQNYHVSAPDDHGSRFHYREHGQQISDEDSEEGRSSQSRRPTRQLDQPSHQHQRGQSPSPRYPSRSPRQSYEQDQASKPNARSTMSISSLLDIQARPQSRCSSQSDDIESDSQAQEYQHYQHNHGHNHEHSHDLNHDRIRRYHHHDDGPETEIAAADISSQSRHHQHHHHEQALQPHSGDMAHRHHHHIPHQHHQHLPAHQYPHGHVHHHHPQLAAHQHQHTHQHPLPPHHHHHHVHHHHLHHGKSASPASAFSYMPKSLGLRLNPKLKVNATQVYISYLIQLDQMQRAQHLMRSSEKRKSVHDAVATQAKSSDVIPHKHHHRVHSRTPSSGEPSRDVQVISIPDEEIGERDTRPCSPLSDASGERKKRHSQRLEEADMAPGDNGSHQVVTLGNSERISRQGPTHTHLPSRHQHQGQHPHVHAHAHAHAHHSAPVLPVHIHPAQHHHHIVPSTAKLDRGASKANGSQNVHRHHALHHHHPHHHPYHPNHPNHQHHFHHHPHPASHNHSHNHHPHGYALMHGHNHAHARHTHAHNHGGHVHTHAHNHSPSHDNNSPVPERTHRERGHSRGDSQKLALPAPNYSSKSDLMPAIPSITAASPSTPPAQRHDRLSDADVDKDEQCAGRDRAVSRDDGVAGQGKDMEIEDSRKQQQESGASSPPRPALVDPIPTLESAENAMILD